ncbi:VOC family protein [Pseudomonas sp. UBA6562]|uniref:VOC family protein n=1 Tax=Pseudomonas sp. UBA6562 TaxID=1947332 RepID=UPI0025FA4C63|nr:VOC family protein [Pseudomonas sp. UBA6562]
MFSHIQLGTRDLPRMIAFYDAVLTCLGLERLPQVDDQGPEGAGWQTPGAEWPQFYVQRPYDGQPASAGNGTQVSFAAQGPDQVQAAWGTALRHGGSDEGAPGPRPQYGAGFYAAYCRDPEGNKLCFVFSQDW